MVTFICETCNESLRKNKVDSHSCRSRTFSCVDCHKQFRNQEWQSHTSCMTEAEKFKFASTTTTTTLNKNSSWIIAVQDAATKNDLMKRLLERAGSAEMIPKRKPKFANFVKSTLHVSDQDKISQAFDLLKTTNTSSSSSNDNKKRLLSTTTIHSDESNNTKRIKPTSIHGNDELLQNIFTLFNTNDNNKNQQQIPLREVAPLVHSTKKRIKRLILANNNKLKLIYKPQLPQQKPQRFIVLT
jgi:hypothetical protein